MASLLLVAPDAVRFLEQTRAIVDHAGGVSSWNGKLLARIVCQDFYSLHNSLVALIILLNNTAGVPKVCSI